MKTNEDAPILPAIKVFAINSVFSRFENRADIGYGSQAKSRH